MFFAALFATGRTWKQPGCLQPDEWIKKMSYIHITKRHSAIKRKEFQSLVVR